ncbi:MAG: cell wall-binding repeat-containing protein [Clostridia bacterium]|nr:cell wall-binding repeat-containing protein [Clostridia bacterium]
MTSFKPNESVTVPVTVSPINATNSDLVWISENPDVASVDNGVITAVNYGETVVYVRAIDTEDVELQLKITVSPYTRLFGTSRYDTAIAISDEGWESADTVVLANGTNYADALAGVLLAYKLNAPILLTAGKAQLEASVAEQIEKLGATKVVLLGGSFAISEDIENELKANYTVERVFGTTRYDTALEISKIVEPDPSTVFVVTGTNYADALSVSPYAAMKAYPIVYSNPTSGLTPSTVEYLSSAQKIYIIGGEMAVGQNTVDQLEGKDVERIFGTSRYLTSYEIANKFADEFGNAVMFATGTNFPDALAGGVLGAKIGTPLLLTHPNGTIEEIKDFVLDKNPRTVYILGGVGAVPDSVIEDIFE